MAKLWERPWTSEEMRENAGNWNLAGDAGLLRHLQQFSQDLIGRIHLTNSAMDDMFRKLNNVATEINNVNNTFLSLANTQFVENRVYEDEEKDSPTGAKEQIVQPKSKEAMEAEMIKRVKQSLEIGFAVMDTKFNAIEVSGSDSEDEGSPSSVIRTVLEPKNPYLHWPLPHLIGSTEFMGDDSVGLVPANEDVMTPPLTAHSSTSDLNEDLVEESRDSLVKQASDWLSETEDVDMFGRDSSPEEHDFEAPNSRQAKSAASFAEELSSKLGGVASAGVDKKSTDLWDEPAKLNVALNDSIVSTKSALPSGGPSLFGPSNDLFRDDDDEDEIFTVKDKKKSEVPTLFEKHSPALQILESNSPNKSAEPKLEVSKPEMKFIPGGGAFSTPLFDDEEGLAIPGNISRIEKQPGLFDDDGDDDDLFSAALSKPKEAAAHQLFNDMSSEVSVSSYEPSNQTLNRPVFGSTSSGLFSFADTSNISIVQENVSETVDKNDSMASVPTPDHASENWLNKSDNKSNSMFDEEGASDSLFHASSRDASEHESSTAPNKKLLSLFEDSERLPADTRVVTEGKSEEKSLFDDEDLFSQSSHEPNYDIFGSSQGKITSNDSLFAFQSSNVGASNIFNTGGDETDDIFAEPQTGPPLYEDVEDLFSSSPSQKSQSSEPKINPPASLSIKLPDLFLDKDDANMDLFGLNTNASSKKNISSLFDGVSASLDSNEKESSPQFEHIHGKQEIVSEPLQSKEEKPDSKAIVGDREKVLGIFKEPLTAPQKDKVNEPLSSSVGRGGAITQGKPWSRDKVIGKIKSPVGFIVDPLALLPGSKPPPRDKSTANEPATGSGLSNDSINIGVANSWKETSPFDIVVATTSTAVLPSSSFGATSVAPTLHSAVKERAKIQVKRRPQSRRARHEAIRSSALFTDDDLVVTGNPLLAEPISIAKDTSPEKHKVETHRKLVQPKATISKALKTEFSDEAAKGIMSAEDIASPSTDEEDLFGVPQVTYKDKGDLEDQLFGSATVLSPYGEKLLGVLPKMDTNAVQVSRVVQQPKATSNTSVDILASDPFSSDENLFSSSTSQKDSLFLDSGSSKAISNKSGFSRPKGNTKSLFDDEDDDDIFSKSSKIPAQITTKPAEAKHARATPSVVKASLKKIQDPFDDPLSSLPQN